MDFAKFEEKVVTKAGKQELKEFNYEELCRVVNAVAKEVYGTKPQGEKKQERDKRKKEIQVKWREVSTAEAGLIPVKMEETQESSVESLPSEQDSSVAKEVSAEPAETETAQTDRALEEELEKVIEDIERHAAEEVPELVTLEACNAILQIQVGNLTRLCMRQEAFIEGIIMGHALAFTGVITLWLLLKYIR